VHHPHGQQHDLTAKSFKSKAIPRKFLCDWNLGNVAIGGSWVFLVKCFQTAETAWRHCQCQWTIKFSINSLLPPSISASFGIGPALLQCCPLASRIDSGVADCRHFVTPFSLNIVHHHFGVIPAVWRRQLSALTSSCYDIDKVHFCDVFESSHCDAKIWPFSTKDDESKHKLWLCNEARYVF
jgi:hypothetical protein